MSRSRVIIIFCVLIGAGFTGAGFFGYHRTLNSPGHLSSAHARFGSACISCHEPWSDSFEAKCLHCHERTLAGDSHSHKVMAELVNLHVPDGLIRLDCANCHKEHIKSGAKLYTGKPRFCANCHKAGSINEEHIVLQKYSCTSTDCHSYHFNLYQDNNQHEKIVRLLPESKPPPKAPKPAIKKIGKDKLLTMQADPFYKAHPITTARYEIGSHFGTEATCNLCHKNKRGEIDLAPPIDKCFECHKTQTQTFAEGRHGAPYGLGIKPAQGETKRVECGSCHNVHSVQLEESRGLACLRCHDSAHVENSLKSLHSIYLADPVFKLNSLKGADCATCHMPKLAELDGWTDHNESFSSTTISRMAEVVCLRCHGVNFALKSLRVKDTVESGFTYSPGIEDQTRKPDSGKSEK